jgi:hypothetical protein
VLAAAVFHRPAAHFLPRRQHLAGTQHLAPGGQLARAVDMLTAHQPPDGGRLPQSPATLARPADASAAACLLLIADQILKEDTTAVREAVRALLPETIDRASRTGWRLTFLKTDEAACSPGLSAAVRPVLSRDRWNPGQGRRRQPELRTGLAPQHVPQHLPEESLRRHFGTSAPAVPMTVLQRATTTRLVQMLADDLFDESVRAIAAELRDGELINYQARRGSSPVGIELHRLLNDCADMLGHRIDAGLQCTAEAGVDGLAVAHHQRGHVAEPPFGLVEYQRRGSGVGKVGLDGGDCRAVPAERSFDGAGCPWLGAPGHSLVIGGPVGERDVPAGCREPGRDARADADGAANACDECHRPA